MKNIIILIILAVVLNGCSQVQERTSGAVSEEYLCEHQELLTPELKHDIKITKLLENCE